MTTDADSAATGTVVVMPLYEDWSPATRLLADLDAVAREVDGDLSVVVVNDGSPDGGGFDPGALARLGALRSVEQVDLATNLGHPRAIAIGLSYVAREKEHGRVVVMDSDGEDVASDLAVLLRESRERPSHVVVARRARRSEGLAFRLFYVAYKALFRLLTGRHIRFGNFCVLPRDVLQRLVHMPELWSHLAACVVRSGLPRLEVPTARGTRYDGESRMGFTALVQHAVGAFSVDLDRMLVRVLVTLSCGVLLELLAMAVVTFLRFGTGLAIPGWASTVFGQLAVLLVLSVGVAVVLLFVNLKFRTVGMNVPALTYRDFVARTRVLHERS